MQYDYLDQDLEALFADDRRNYVVDFRPDINATLSKEPFSRRDVRQIERNLSSLKRYRLRQTIELPEEQLYSFDVKQRSNDFLKILIPSNRKKSPERQRPSSRFEGMRPQTTNVKLQYSDFRGRQDWQARLPQLQGSGVIVRSYALPTTKRQLNTTAKQDVFVTQPDPE